MNILIVDDHPMTVNGYIYSLQNFCLSQSLTLNISKAYTCGEAFHLIKNAKHNPVDIAIIDKSLPAYEEQSIYSGSELALYIRTHLPHCKIIMITAHTEVIVVYDIVKKVRPEGLVIKNDITPENLPVILNEVIHDNHYQSPTVKKCIGELWKKDLLADDYNRQILLYLSRGFKIKELENVICLSTSAIQKRIIQMKKAFDVAEDGSLIKEAYSQKFI